MTPAGHDVAEDDRPVVLMLARDFHPGAQACGPAQSISQMNALLGDRFRFRVLSRLGEGEREGRWSRHLGVEQRGVAVGGLRGGRLASTIRETPHDLLVFNSFWDPHFTILPLAYRRLNGLSGRPVLLAPRGEFSPGAMALKPGKKQAYLALAKATGLLRGVTFHATVEEEAALIRQTIGSSARVLVGPNLRTPRAAPEFEPRLPGAPLRMAFISRIDRKKNLRFAIDCVAHAGVPVEFTIYGPVSDPPYWEDCQRAIEAAGAPATIRYGGVLTQDDIPRVLARTDLFFLPTLGENYGHSIVDALMAGTPVLISDLTPWHGLASANAGWDIALGSEAPFIDRIAQVAAMPESDLREMRASALAYFRAYEKRVGPTEQMANCLAAAMAAR